jgi:hypothetical protein
LREDGPKTLLGPAERVFTFVVRQVTGGPEWVAVQLIGVGVLVADVLFVLLTLVVFGLLALAAKGAEKL